LETLLEEGGKQTQLTCRYVSFEYDNYAIKYRRR
jgi:hypothetical protein